MNCISRVGLFTVLGLGLLAGCSKSGSSDGTAATSNGTSDTAVETAVVNPADLSNNPAAKAAADFLDALLKGDTQRASARLTPDAMQRIVSSGKQFSPPGLDNATFRVVEVRSPSESQSIVLCQLSDLSQATPHTEEMCCVLRKVENDWRVCGIAHGSNEQPWILDDFESGKSQRIPGQGMSSGNSGMVQNSSAPSPTQVAPVSPQAPVGMPPVQSNYNSPAPGTTGLGMPSVGAPTNQPYQAQAPYTAQGPQPTEQR